MNVGSSLTALRAAQTAYTQKAEPVQQEASVAMLKKALDAEKAQAAELLKALEPKGRVIDIRV
jgi:hypothetical protein